jgi:arylformamidase
MVKDYTYYDLTLPLNKEIPKPPAIPVKPGDPPREESRIPSAQVYRFLDVDKGDKVTLSRIEMTTHDGTHIDSPRHFIPGGPTIDTMDLNISIGPCRVIEIKDPKEVTVNELEPYKIKAGERILLKTKNSPRVWSKRQWDGDFVTVTLEACKYLAEKQIRIIGFDYISLASAVPPENITWVHETFLKKGIYILEAINLDGIKPGKYELICLPLRIDKGDAGPCRVILRK